MSNHPDITETPVDLGAIEGNTLFERIEQAATLIELHEILAGGVQEYGSPDLNQALQARMRKLCTSVETIDSLRQGIEQARDHQTIVDLAEGVYDSESAELLDTYLRRCHTVDLTLADEGDEEASARIEAARAIEEEVGIPVYYFRRHSFGIGEQATALNPSVVPEDELEEARRTVLKITTAISRHMLKRRFGEQYDVHIRLVDHTPEEIVFDEFISVHSENN